MLRLTEALSGLCYCVEHGLNIRGRSRDNIQDVADCGLILQRFLKLTFAGLNLVEKADILDGNYGLIGECFTSAICLSVNGLTSSL